MRTLQSIFLAARPKTLPAGLVAVWAGCVVVDKFATAYPQLHIAVNYDLAVFTALSCMCIQIACNLFNDALDAGRHADTERRQGPLRITAGGRMSALSVKLWGGIFLLLACIAAIPLIQAQGATVIFIGLPCLICAYAYTGGPFPIAYHGLGELFVLLFFWSCRRGGHSICSNQLALGLRVRLHSCPHGRRHLWVAFLRAD